MGDALAPYNHPAIAAAILKPFVSEANHWMVEQHGVFQATTSGTISAGIGEAREAFRDSPWFEYTAEFCAKYDQVAFDADYRSGAPRTFRAAHPRDPFR